jgi:hypothetical protein
MRLKVRRADACHVRSDCIQMASPAANIPSQVARFLLSGRRQRLVQDGSPFMCINVIQLQI